MQIRAAAPAEFGDVLSFYNALIDAMRDAPFRPGWEKGVYPTEAFIRASLRSGELFVGLSGGRIIASMVVNHACADGYDAISWGIQASAEEVSVIHALGVSPACQGQGLARQMVLEAVRTARENRQKAVRLDVLASNLPAQKLYSSLGFQYRDTVQLYYEDTGLTDFLLYELVL